MATAGEALRTVRARTVDRHFLDQALLDVAKRDRTNALPWRGQFTPGLPEAMLRALGPDGLVFDPFVGSGTTLGEAMHAGLPSAGTEVNPAALSLAQVYELAGLEVSSRQLAVKRAEALIQHAAVLSSDGLLTSGLATHLALLDSLRDQVDGPESVLVVAALMLAMGNTRQTTPVKLIRSWAQVKGLVERLPTARSDVQVITADARDVPLSDGSVGMVMTSPPYVNVFNYHQNYRPVMEMLGWDILPAARSEIGSNRKHRGNRFLTVIQYCLDMAETLDEMARLTHSGAPLVFVVGRESRVRGAAFPNGDMLAALVELTPALVFERWQERSFTSRFGERIYEEVLTFRRASTPGAIDANEARGVGIEVLEEALATDVDAAVRVAIVDAINRAGEVSPSPPLALKRAHAV